MILLRTTAVDDRLVRFSRELGEASGLEVRMLVDERRGTSDARGVAKVSLTDRELVRLGLFRPRDVGWRCGDYGFYLARDLFPDRPFFWMIDYDVRVAGDARRFFALCDAEPDTDLLAGYLRPAEPDWYWRKPVTARGVESWRCFFPVVRLSARAVDHLHAKRRAHRFQVTRRMLWANDEAFVATTLVNDGRFVAKDLNGLGERFYDPGSFSYVDVVHGDAWSPGPVHGAPRLIHPVLYSPQYEAKLARLRRETRPPGPLTRAMRVLLPPVNRHRGW